MLLRFALVGFAFSALFLSACGGGGSPSPTVSAPTPSPTPTSGPATITKSASTNTVGYTIVVQPGGSAMITENNATSTGTVAAATAAQLFSDLNANTPVVDITTYAPCTKSASFGSTTTVTYETYTTGDISCPAPASPAPVTTVYNDVQNVETSLGLPL